MPVKRTNPWKFQKNKGIEICIAYNNKTAIGLTKSNFPFRFMVKAVLFEIIVIDSILFLILKYF